LHQVGTSRHFNTDGSFLMHKVARA